MKVLPFFSVAADFSRMLRSISRLHPCLTNDEGRSLHAKEDTCFSVCCLLIAMMKSNMIPYTI